ncbi:MAG: hypothetical protein K2X81_05360, partial [Candidatus Obscuribacterales bacterium]|nr:hypothetical protein [Candidatus Obscuribacterales bacterium]
KSRNSSVSRDLSKNRLILKACIGLIRYLVLAGSFRSLEEISSLIETEMERAKPKRLEKLYSSLKAS